MTLLQAALPLFSQVMPFNGYKEERPLPGLISGITRVSLWRVIHGVLQACRKNPLPPTHKHPIALSSRPSVKLFDMPLRLPSKCSSSSESPKEEFLRFLLISLKLLNIPPPLPTPPLKARTRISLKQGDREKRV